MKANPVRVRQLPNRPQCIFQNLLTYELNCQQLPEKWEVSDLIDVLMSHPSISCSESARRLANKIYEAVASDLGQPDVSVN